MMSWLKMLMLFIQTTSNFVKKTDYDTKNKKIKSKITTHDKYITT